jgi:hypothetical protein
MRNRGSSKAGHSPYVGRGGAKKGPGDRLPGPERLTVAVVGHELPQRLQRPVDVPDVGPNGPA